MQDTQTLLESVYRNTQMGIQTLDRLVEMKIDEGIKHELQTQKTEYEEIFYEAESMLKERNWELKKVNPVAVKGAEIVISARCATDRSPAHIAEMVMKGNANGIIAVAKNLRRFEKSDKEVLDLAGKLLLTEENNFRSLKPFLS